MRGLCNIPEYSMQSASPRRIYAPSFLEQRLVTQYWVGWQWCRHCRMRFHKISDVGKTPRRSMWFCGANLLRRLQCCCNPIPKKSLPKYPSSQISAERGCNEEGMVWSRDDNRNLRCWMHPTAKISVIISASNHTFFIATSFSWDLGGWIFGQGLFRNGVAAALKSSK